jgi:hypothetical protein
MKLLKSISFLFVLAILLIIWACSDDSSEPQVEVVESGEFLDEFTYRVFPKPGDNFDIAEFRLWFPEAVEGTKLILVLSHSYNSNGLGMADSKIWQEYAKAEHMAILSVHFKNLTDSGGYYALANEGSGKALLEALTVLSNKHEHGFLAELPMVLRGYSAGGVFSHSFSSFLPRRVVAFANIRGGGVQDSGEENINIPGLMFYGELDNQGRNDRIKEVVVDKRSIGGQWAVVQESQVDHFGSSEKADALIREFFSSCARKRLTEGSNELMTLSEERGWLGNNSTYEVKSFDQYAQEKEHASWLVDSDFARLWSDFQK